MSEPAGDPTASAAVAVWVKTPGRSPVKTRLAASIGTAAAEAFYAHAVRAVEAVVRAAVDSLGAGALTPYWAVAESEPEASASWGSFATVAQGGGGLGERLAHVYDALRARHERVLFIGADAPQLAPPLLADAVRCLTPSAAGGGDDFVLGPADDGGFYLFGGRLPLPGEVWTEVPYSDPGTLAALAPRLAARGSVAVLPPAFDVDTADELARLGAVLRAGGPELLPEQRALAGWIAGRGVRGAGVTNTGVTGRVLARFAAGAAAVAAVHQPAVWVLHRAGVVPWTAYSLAPTRPLGVPQVASAAFWGGVWWVVLAPAVERAGARRGDWARAATLGAVAPTTVGALLVAAGRAFPRDGTPAAVLLGAGLGVNALWGLGAAALVAVIRRRSPARQRPDTAARTARRSPA